MKFTVYQPRSQQQALNYISKGRKDVFLLAGGTDLLIDIRNGDLKPRSLVDLSHLTDLRYIRTRDSLVKIGALTRISDIGDYDWSKANCEVLHQVAEKFGGPAIANVATIGGDVCTASPSADMLPVLLSLDARLILRSRKSDRIIRVEDFLVGNGTTVLRSNEIIVEAQFEAPPTDALCLFNKIGRRSALFIASVSLAVFIRVNQRTKTIIEARVALNDLRRRLPERSALTEASLRGRILDQRTIDGALSELSKEMHMVSDMKGTAVYKAEAAKALLEEQLLCCVSRLEER